MIILMKRLNCFKFIVNQFALLLIAMMEMFILLNFTFKFFLLLKFLI